MSRTNELLPLAAAEILGHSNVQVTITPEGEIIISDLTVDVGPLSTHKVPPATVNAVATLAWEMAERERIPTRVTAAQAKVALFRRGLLATVETAVQSYPADVRLWFDNAAEWDRTNPYIQGIALELDLSDEEVDGLFGYASTLET